MNNTDSEVLVIDLIIQDEEPQSRDCLWGDLTNTNTTPDEQSQK